MPRPLRLGECLEAQGAISRATLDAALDQQARQGGRLGERLLHAGQITSLQLVTAVADQSGHGRADLFVEPSDASFGAADDLRHYLRFGIVPHRSENGRPVIAALDPTPTVRAFIRQRFGPTADIRLATPREWRRALEGRYGRALLSHATDALWQRLPRYSARRQTSDRRMLKGLFSLAAVVALSPAIPLLHQVVLAAASCFFLSALGLRAFLLRKLPPPAPTVIEDGRDWPIYTVLVPLYRESGMLPRLLRSLDALDYPREKLDVKLILEGDDAATYDAACRLHPPAYVEIIRVPPSMPRTKPKACNYALHFARGNYVTIFDAEDRPEPGQLKKAVTAFETAPADIVCLQARLDYDNRSETWLTRLFALEYALLFTRMIPAMHRHGIPIPLGGTSNHLRMSALRWIREWDPYNVTEDADLGLRLAAAGYRTAPLDSVTYEEAPHRPGPWVRQRGRWIKGYLMTWTVHLRHPLALQRHVGMGAFAALQLFIGGASVVYLISPILWAQAFLWWLLPAGSWTAPSPSIVNLCGWTLATGFILQWASAWAVVRQEGWQGMAWAILLFPFYWLLHSVAAIRALWQLFGEPYRWDKTEHRPDARRAEMLDSATASR